MQVSKILFLENAPWPHSWANTQNPIAVVPDRSEYKIQIGIIVLENGIKSPIQKTINWIKRDWNRYLKEVFVLIEKQSRGKALLISMRVGISLAVTCRAFPLRAENLRSFK